LQIVLYAPMSLLYLNVITGTHTAFVGFWPVARSVLVFLGAPMTAALLVRYSLIWLKGYKWFEEQVLPRIAPIAPLSLVYTVIVLFALQGHEVVTQIGDVCRVAVPFVIYFVLMWSLAYGAARFMRASYAISVTQAFTAASNNFELAIAIAAGTFGSFSKETLAATVGPLVEVPAMLLLVWVAHRLKPAPVQPEKEVQKELQLKVAINESHSENRPEESSNLII